MRIQIPAQELSNVPDPRWLIRSRCEAAEIPIDGVRFLASGGGVELSVVEGAIRGEMTNGVLIIEWDRPTMRSDAREEGGELF